MRCRYLILAFAFVLGAGCQNSATPEPVDSTADAPRPRPNVLLVMADDMGWTDLGSFGSAIDTPNLDALASQGVKFSNFYASVSCSPTRSMLMTGNDNHLVGLGNMGELLTPEQVGHPGYEGHLNDRVASLAEVLGENGYHTYMAGKWHLGHSPSQYPAARGFERSFSMLLGGASYWADMFGMLAETEPMAEYVIDHEQVEELPGDFYATRSFADFVMDAIREDRGDGQPFFAYLAFTSPHDPMHVPEPWLSKYRGQYDDGYEALKARRSENARKLGLIPADAQNPERYPGLKPWESLTDEERALGARGMEVYAGMVDNMDYHFGRVVKFLKDIGEYDNTIVIFLSDNGPNPWFSEDYPGNAGSEWFAQFDNSIDNIGHPMSHYAYGLGWGSASAGPLDRFKMTVAEGGIRTPLIVAGPNIDSGRQVDAFAYVWDLMPTVLDQAGIDHPQSFQGRDVLPLRGKSMSSVLAGSADRVYGDDEFVGGEMGNGKWMRQGRYKAVSVAPPYGDGNWYLYDVINDPGETQNLADELPDVLDRLQTAWSDYAEEVGVVLTN